jgi:hypothetical protein
LIPVLRIGALSGQPLPSAQHFRIAVFGAEVQRIRPETDIYALPDPEEQMVDPVALLAAGAARGLFSGSAGVAGKISTHAERLADTRPDIVEWSLSLGGVDLGALRLLANMLAYGRFDSAEIVADGCVGGAVTQSAMLSYPSCIPPQEFTFVHDPPAKSHSERGVRLIFADEPDDVTLDLVIASLDTWGNIMMAGGYDGGSGANAFANKAALEESCVVGVSLMVSGVNELMFSPVVNLAQRVHALYAPLERLELV